MDDEPTQRIDLPGGTGEPPRAEPPRPEAPNAEPPVSPADPPGPPPPPVALDSDPVALPPPPPPPAPVPGAPASWAAPPRARLDVGSIVGRTFDTYGREWSLFMALAVPAALGGFASGAFSQSFQAILRDPGAAGAADPWPLLAAQLIISLLTGVTTLATVVATDRLWRGEAIGLSDAVGKGLSLLPRAIGFLLVVIGLSVVVGIVLVVGILVMAVLGPIGILVGGLLLIVLIGLAFYVGARLSVLLPVLALEPVPVLEVLGRTWRLTRGSALPLFLTAFVIGLCGLLPAWGSTLFSLFVDDRLVAAVAIGLATLVTAPLSGIWAVLAWGDLTGSGHRDSEVMAAGRGRNVGVLLVVGVGLVLLLVGGALASTGSAEFLRLYEGR